MTDRYSENKDELDLIGFLQIIFKGRKIIIKFLIVFALLGVFLAIFTEKEYVAETIVIPQVSNKKMRGLGGLAAIAGINIGNANEGAITPLLYPKIIASIPFKRELIKTKLSFSKVDGEVTFQEYYEKYKKPSVVAQVKKYTIGLPGVIIVSIAKLFKSKKETSIPKMSSTNDSILKVSLIEKKIFNGLKEQLDVKFNEDDGTVKIRFYMDDPVAAAQMTKASQRILQAIITKFKVQKIKEDLNFIQKRHDEVKKDFLKKQGALASYKDRNQGAILFRSKTRLERLQSQYNLSYSLYSELEKQLETQKIRLNSNTPVFTVVDPVSIPTGYIKPKRLMIFVIWTFVGIVLGIATVFLKKVYKKFRS